MSRMPAQIFLLIVLSALVMFINLGSARLWDRDEPRNAGSAVEMMQRGNLVVPMFNDELRHQKPALLYWLMISAYTVFGVSEFSARFWSALLAIGSVLATYGIGRRLLNPTAGMYGGLALATSMMFVVAGRAATPDSLLIFCSTMAMLFYVLGTFAPRGDGNEEQAPTLRHEHRYFPVGTGYVIGMYGMMGLAVLAKGPVGFVLPCAIIGMFMLLMRLPPLESATWNQKGWLQRVAVAAARPFEPRHFLVTLWTMRPLTLAAVVLLVAAPWYIAVGIQTHGAWPRIFFLNENLARATSTFESHGGAWWYYPLTIIVGFFPASVFLGPMALRIDQQITSRHPWTTAHIFLLCWVGVQVVLFSLASTKLPSYITPCYPAIALLTGAWLAQLSAKQFRDALQYEKWPAMGLCLSGIGVAIGLAVVGIQFLDGNMQLAVAGLLLIGGAAAMVLFTRKHQTQRYINAFFLTAILFAVGMFGFGTTIVDGHREENRILEHVANNDAAVCAAFGCLESSWVYYGGKPFYELAPEYRDSPWRESRQHYWQRKSWPSPEQFSRTYPDALIITVGERLQELRSRLPEYRVVERARYFLKDEELVLLGRVDENFGIRSTQVPREAGTFK